MRSSGSSSHRSQRSQRGQRGEKSRSTNREGNSSSQTSGRSPKRRRVVKRGSRAPQSPQSAHSQQNSSKNSTGNSRSKLKKKPQSHGRSPANGSANRGRNTISQRPRRSRATNRPSAATNQAKATTVQAKASPEIAGATAGLADESATFGDLGLSIPIVKALAREGINHPFPIQASAIPEALQGRDILGRGPTGSGKTFTFGLPIIESLQRGASAPQKPRALILVPTRELATQVRQRLEPIANAAGQRVLEVVGGVKIARHITALARPVDILVATPGRAQDLLNQHYLDFQKIQTVVLDEADQMADMGFLPQITKLFNQLPPDCQHLLFSATLDSDVQVLVDRFMNDPAIHSTGEAIASVNSMKHLLAVFTDRDERNAAVIDLGHLGVRTVMFLRTKYAVDRQVKKLTRSGIKAVGLHGKKGQSTREKALEAFSSGDAPVLVATDIAARGIDVKDVELVVHVDPPAEHKAYVHRAGRTARAGATGTVVTLTFEDIKDDTLKMMKKAGVNPEIVDGPEISHRAEQVIH